MLGSATWGAADSEGGVEEIACSEGGVRGGQQEQQVSEQGGVLWQEGGAGAPVTRGSLGAAVLGVVWAAAASGAASAASAASAAASGGLGGSSRGGGVVVSTAAVWGAASTAAWAEGAGGEGGGGPSI